MLLNNIGSAHKNMLFDNAAINNCKYSFSMEPEYKKII